MYLRAKSFGQMRFLIACSLPFLFLCCENKKTMSGETVPIKTSGTGSIKGNEFDYNGQFKLENYLAADPNDISKIQVIDFDCAIFVYPTHRQVEEMKKAEGEDEFYTLADDANFYQARAIQLFDSAGVKTIGANKDFLKLVGNGSQWLLEIRKQNLPAWNLILFKKDKTPQPTPAVNVTYESIKTYFK